MTGETILLHPERQKGLQGKIAAARAKRLDAGLDREVFMDDATPEPPEAFETTHQAFREELRRIIAGDAVVLPWTLPDSSIAASTTR